MPEQIEHPGTIIGVDEIADPRLQQACRRSMNDVAISTVDEPETSRRIDLSDAHVGMTQQGAEVLLLERQLGSDTLPLRDIRAHDEAQNRSADQEYDGGQERIFGTCHQCLTGRPSAPDREARENER